MATASDAVWLPVLPDMSGFGKGIIAGVAAPGRKAGGKFGKAFLSGFTVIAGGAAALGTALYKIGSTFDEMSDTIQVGTGATGAALDGLVDSAKRIGTQVPAEYDKIGDAVAALNTHTGATGEVLEGLTGQVLEASRMLGEDGAANADKFGRALNQWQIPAEEGEGALDALFVATQKYGVSLDGIIGHLNTYGPVLQNAGFSMEESAALFGQLEQGGISVSRVMPGLNASFRKWAGEGKNSREELERNVNAIRDTEDAQEALALATDVFGAEGAQRLTTAIRNGTLELGDLTDALGDSDGAIAQSSEETQSFAEKWQMFKNEILTKVAPAAEWLFDVVSDGMGWLLDKGVPAVSEFVSEWRDRLEPTFNRVGGFITGTLIPGFKTFVGWLKENAEWIKPIVVGIGTMIALWASYKATMLIVNGVQKAWTAITTGMTAAQKLLNGALRANPIGIIITLLTGLVAGLVYAYKNSETFRNIVNGVWASIKKAVGAVWNFLRDKVFKPLIKFIGDTIQWFKDFGSDTKKSWTGFRNMLSDGWKWIKKNVFDRMKNALTALAKWFKDKIDNIKKTWNGIKAAFRAVYDWVKQRVFDAFRTAANNMKNNFSNAIQRIKDIWNGIKTPFRAVYNWVKRNVIDRFKSSLDNFLQKVRTIRDRVGNAWRGIANKFRNPINWVIRVVWNDGLAGAFNRAASAIGISTRLPDAVQIPAFAKGGRHHGGWALVGEEGPELVNFTDPGRIYTAADTAAALSQGRDLSPQQQRAAAGRSPSEALAPMGGLWGTVSNWVSGAVDWVRGALADAAGAVLSPLKSLVNNTVGQWGTFGRMGGGTINKVIDNILDWIRGKDEEVSPDGGTAPGSGAWRRPSRGPITSGYGPRWGAFHAGIDVAGGGPTYAAADGTVYRVGTGILGGRTGVGIGINHGGGVFTYYGHNPYGGPRVRPGQAVKAGQHIGYQGATGNVTGTHLHFELHRGGWGRHVNPRSLGVFDGGNGWLNPGDMAYHSPRMSKPDAILSHQQWNDIHRLASDGSGGLDKEAVLQAVREGASRGSREGVSSGLTGATRGVRSTGRMGGF